MGSELEVSKTLKELSLRHYKSFTGYRSSGESMLRSPPRPTSYSSPMSQLIYDREFWSEFRGALWDHRLMTDVSTIIPLELTLALGYFAALPRPSGMHCRLTFETTISFGVQEQTESKLFSTSFQLTAWFYLSEYTMRLRFNFTIDISSCALYKYR